jgi:deoxyadenosine/deoxycytidine kinase
MTPLQIANTSETVGAARRRRADMAARFVPAAGAMRAAAPRRWTWGAARRWRSAASGPWGSAGAGRLSGSGRAVRIAVEGNIASGKSTLLELIRTEFAVFTVQEPVGKWQQVDGADGADGVERASAGNLLELFYSDPKRWAYTFQTYAFLSRLQAQTSAAPDNVDVIVMERSVMADYHIFAKNCYKTGLFSEIEWSLYRQWFAWLAQQFPPQFEGTIYLRTSPDVCLHRLKKRARGEESTIPLEYLQQLHSRHDEWCLPS